MANSKKESEFFIISNLNGGLATRPTPLLIENGTKQKMRSPAILNADMFTSGSIKKRLGLTQQGGFVAGGGTWATQTVSNAEVTVGPGALTTLGFAQKITASSTTQIQTLIFKVRSAYGGNAVATIRADSAGSPGSVITNGTSSSIGIGLTLANYSFNFLIPPSVTSATVYWFCVQYTPVNLSDSLSAGSQSGASGNVFQTTDGFSTSAVVAYANLYYTIYNFDANQVVNGVYDYRFGSSSTQKQIAAAGGGVYWNNSGTWTSIITGLASGQDNLYSFRTLKDYLFISDYATNAQRVWNGSAAYTIAHGFRPAGTFARSATGGSIANGTYKVMLVTTLTSGGYRAGVENTVTTTGGGTDKIAGTSVVVNNTGATDFGFDAGATCTTVFMTLAGGSTYYKLATASSSVGNPLPNGTTSFNITASPVGTENTLLLEYTREQGYFTSQVTTPVVKYLEVFQGMLAMAGSGDNPSRVWFSQLDAPQIWSTRGGIEGGYLDLDPNDGEVVTGLKQWNGNLYAFKRHAVFLIEYTGVASSPFVWKRLTGNIGALSHWAIKEIGAKGLIFLSERGPCLCLGSFVTTIPATQLILDRFDPNNATRYNLSAMSVTTAGNNATKSQVHFGVSSTSATTRDLTLVYDYENEAFWENSISANYYTEVTDSNFFPFIWSGNYSAQVFKHDAGTNDNGSAINFYFDTPLIQLGAPFYFKMISELYVAGAVQSSGTLYVDVYLENSSTVSQTLSFDMTNTNFKGGLSEKCNQRAKLFKFRVRNSDLDVPVAVEALGFSYTILTDQY